MSFKTQTLLSIQIHFTEQETKKMETFIWQQQTINSIIVMIQ